MHGGVRYDANVQASMHISQKLNDEQVGDHESQNDGDKSGVTMRLSR